VATIITPDKQAGIYSQGCEGRADSHRPTNYLPGKSIGFLPAKQPQVAHLLPFFSSGVKRSVRLKQSQPEDKKL
jgi:hypothetical protein